MSTSQCLITGADFLDVERQRWIHGDLHQLLDILIFNATGCAWVAAIESPLPEGSMAVRCDVFFEKNNVLVFPLALSNFNEEANRYLNKLIKAEQSQIITFGAKSTH